MPVRLSVRIPTRPAVLQGEKYFGYVDETDIKIKGSSGERLVGAGMLITSCPMPEDITTSAIDALRDDDERFLPKSKDQDERTLVRGWFHASDDSKNAHSHLCTSIARGVGGIFVCTLFDPEVLKKSARRDGIKITQLQNAAWTLSTEWLTTGNTPLEVTLEDRQGLGEIERKWVEMSYSRRDHERYSLMRTPIPVFYPKVNCNTAGKSNTGLQIVDFLLWAVNRSLGGDPTWCERLGLVEQYHWRDDKSRNEGLRTFSIGKSDFELPHATYPQSIIDRKKLAFSADRPMQIDKQYYGMEWSVASCAFQRISEIDHLHGGLDLCVTRLLDPIHGTSADTIELVAKMYIRLFDTVPLYSNENSLSDDDLIWSFRTLEMAALALRKDRTESRILVSQLSRMRKHWKSNCPESLVRLEGAKHLWRRVPPSELSIELVANGRRGRATGPVEAL